MNVVTTALRAEAGVVLRHLRAVRNVEVADTLAWTGRGPGGRHLGVCCTGVGYRRAHRSIGPVLELFRPRLLFNWGVGGALSPEFHAGDAVPCRSVVDGRPGCSPLPVYRCPRLPAGPLREVVPGSVRPAGWLTRSGIVLTRGLRRRLGASFECGMVEMEAAALASAAASRGVTFAGLRVVVDEFSLWRFLSMYSLRFVRRAMDATARFSVEVTEGKNGGAFLPRAEYPGGGLFLTP